ncbi:MAG: hypothetical protein H7Y15_10385 [Pseudonocardia sp.]|nr:hypothetical protein [Pseudonocardia sp.]
MTSSPSDPSGGRFPRTGRRVLTTLILAAALSGCGSAPPVLDSGPVIVAPPTPAGQPAVEVDLAEPLAPGAVDVRENTFSDSLAFRDLQLLVADGAATVRGGTFNTINVSPILALELAADFYDEQGRRIGTGVTQLSIQEWRQARDSGSGAMDFSIRAEPGGIEPVAARVTITHLVNE